MPQQWARQLSLIAVFEYFSWCGTGAIPAKSGAAIPLEDASTVQNASAALHGLNSSAPRNSSLAIAEKDFARTEDDYASSQQLLVFFEAAGTIGILCERSTPTLVGGVGVLGRCGPWDRVKWADLGSTAASGRVGEGSW